MRVTACVVSFNTAEHLPGCLDSLAAQTHPDLEVVVVDNASADGSADVVRRTHPDVRLLARQWEKHGTCMARRPETYLKVTRILYNGLQWPDFVRISREDDLTAGIIRTRFADANPGWFPEAVGVHLDRKGWLEELRLCYDNRFMPRACDGRRFGARDRQAARIWRGL